MSARFCVLLALACACGPRDEDAGDESSVDPQECHDTALAAFTDALDATDVALERVAVDVESQRRAIARALGLPDDAELAEVSAAIRATIADGTQMRTLRVDVVRCAGSIAGARASMAICAADLATDALSFSCDGECTIEDSAGCPGAVTCVGRSSSCAGACTGTCDAGAAGDCAGRCIGICSGTCGCASPENLCVGDCTGTCDGTCEIVAQPCTGTCTGSCTHAVAAECGAGELRCSGEGAYCRTDCDGIATPQSPTADCASAAALAGAASMHCEPPVVVLTYAARDGVEQCIDVADVMAVLEDAAGPLKRDLHTLAVLRTALAPGTDGLKSLADALIDEAPPCAGEVVPQLNALLQRLVASGADVTDQELRVRSLYDAIES